MSGATGGSAIVLAEDSGWVELRPLTWLRPAGDLLVGALTNRERWAALLRMPAATLCRGVVASLASGRMGEPPDGAAPRIWVRDRIVPDDGWAAAIAAARGPTAWRESGRIAAVRTDAPAPMGVEPGSDAFWEMLAEGTQSADAPAGQWIAGLGDLIALGADRIAKDLDHMLTRSGAPARLDDIDLYALDKIRLGEGCRIDRGAVLDAREGPIVLGRGTCVSPHTWIRGPFGCGENALLLGGRIGGGTYLGPGCRVRGEVEASFFLGYANKAHDGFVGHSYIGEWVNLGALTTTSDLKNNYGPIRLEINGRRIDTGLIKVGAFIGDHAKTRIGTLLNTGSVVGLAANLFGEVAVFPKWIPDFAWGAGSDAGVYALESCLETVRVVLGRRGWDMPAGLRDAFAEAFRSSDAGRQEFIEGRRVEEVRRAEQPEERR